MGLRVPLWDLIVIEDLGFWYSFTHQAQNYNIVPSNFTTYQSYNLWKLFKIKNNHLKLEIINHNFSELTLLLFFSFSYSSSPLFDWKEVWGFEGQKAVIVRCERREEEAIFYSQWRPLQREDEESLKHGKGKGLWSYWLWGKLKVIM